MPIVTSTISPIVEKIKVIGSNFLEGLGYPGSPKPPVSGISMAVTSENEGNTSTVYAYDGAITNTTDAGAISQKTLCNIGSITKSVISFLLVRAIANSQGQMSLDDPLEKYFLQFNSTSPNPSWGKPTIRQLLNMTSGLPDYLTTDFNQYTADPQKNWTLQEIITAMPQLGETNFAPGTQYEYSNTNYILIGMLLEQVTGSSIQSLVDNLAKEVGIEDEFFYPLTLIPNIDELKHRYLHPLDVNGNDVSMTVNPTILGTAGAIIATPTAICKWVNWLFNPDSNPYLSTMQQMVSMTTGQPISQPTATEWGYGLGIMQGFTQILKYFWMYQGETDGATANYCQVATSNLGTVTSCFATNTEYTNVPNETLTDEILQARGANPPGEQPKAITQPPPSLRSLIKSLKVLRKTPAATPVQPSETATIAPIPAPKATQEPTKVAPIKQLSMLSAKNDAKNSDTEENSCVGRFLNYDTTDFCNALEMTFNWFCGPVSDCDAQETPEAKTNLIPELKPK